MNDTRLNPEQVSQLAAVLHQARQEGRAIDCLTSIYPSFTLADAYRIQEMGQKVRLAEGEKWIGYKMGLTSQAKREQMGLHESIYGFLTDKMQCQEGKLNLKGLIHPKAEPEIAFITSKDLCGTITASDALEACSALCLAIEVLDSRYTGFKYFSLVDVVADNSSSSHFILGEPIRDFKNLNLAALKMTFKLDGKTAGEALSSAISGNPIESVVQLCKLLADRGVSLPAGSIVLTGAATAAVPLSPGSRVELEVAELGKVELVS